MISTQEILNEWRIKMGHSNHEMSRRLGRRKRWAGDVRPTARPASPATVERYAKVRKMEKLIATHPPDIILIKYELEKMIEGFEITKRGPHGKTNFS